MQTKEMKKKRGKSEGDREKRKGRELQRFTGGRGCSEYVRRVGSYAAWLRSPEIFLTHLSF